MIEAINLTLERLSLIISSNAWIAPLVAFLAGALTSLTPCSLSSIPLVVAYVGGTGSRGPSTAFRFSLVFALGTAMTFTALGAAASLLGRLMSLGTASWWYIVLGALMILMALQTWGIITIIPSSYAQAMNTKRGYIGALLTGILGGLFSSPCATPALVAILAVVARSGRPAWGIFLLLLFSLGHSLPVVITGTFMGLAEKIKRAYGFGLASKLLNAILGAAILAAGLYMLYLGF
jgi:cytochrome c biogenesis protein CcdA